MQTEWKRSRVLGWSVVLWAIVWVLQAGCSSNSPLTCPRTVEDACAAGGCALTWNDADLKAAFCQDPMSPTTLVDCGRYHVVEVFNPPAGETQTIYYYDISSGNLVTIAAIGSVMTSSGSILSCLAGPSAGFVAPGCPGASSGALPQCADVGDAGALGDGAAAD